MAYRLQADDASLEAALRRIAGEQFAQAIDVIGEEEPPEAIHEVRRRCKRLRGLIRLVRTGFAGFEAEDDAIRDIAKPLSGLRDARVMLDTFDKLVEQCDDKAERRRLASFRKRLSGERKEMLGEVDAKSLLQEARKKLAAARIRSSGWKLEGDGWDVAGQGVAITYGKALAAAAEAFAGRQPGVFHQLRKHVRYHWCHASLLRELWPDGMSARAALADELADTLGDQHDLWVFTDRLGDFRPGKHRDALIALAHGHNADLEAHSERLAGQLLAESTDALAEHWHALWDNWRKGEFSPPPTG